ncbi:MAG TPA: tyrosine-type recombinase/integrase, partial [Bacillota bacterium]|nr:tyrosine-type recombinase/integrase [Bacillota bacterium]
GLSTHYHMHYLRHTNISLMAAAGVSIDDIFARVGHGDEKMIREIYLHITKERSHTAAETLSSYLKTF